jgi:hypothetical protein
MIVIFHVSAGLVSTFAPFMPSFWTNLTREFTIHKERIAIVTPGATQEYLINIVCCRDVAVVENISIGHILRGRGCSDV